MKSDLTLRELFPAMGALLLAAALPFLAAWALTPPGMVFLGALLNPDDASVYLAAMRQGGAGAWLYRFQFSPEPIPPRLTYLPYLLLGRAAAQFGGAPLLWLHGARLASGALALLALWFWVRQVWPGRARVQLTAWRLIAVGGGLGWLAAILARPDLKRLPDLTLAEWGVLLPLLGMPHFALGLALELLLFGCLLRAANGWRWAALAALCGALLGLVYPFNLAVVGPVVGLWALATGVAWRRIPWRLWARIGLVLLPLLPFVGYYALWARRDPYWAQAQFSDNLVPAPAPQWLALGLGLVGVWALAGGWAAVLGKARGWAPDSARLVGVWALANLLLLYVPLPFAGRFVLGLAVPLGTLAAAGLETAVLPWLTRRPAFSVFSRLTPTPHASLRRVLLLLTLPSTLMAALILAYSPLVRPDFPLYLPEAELRAVAWLAEHASADSVVLAHYPVGNVLPRAAAGRVFLGQPYLTLDLPAKLALLDQFWDPATPDAWRADFVRAWGVSHVYAGRYEQALGADAVTPPGRVIYRANGVTIWAAADE